MKKWQKEGVQADWSWATPDILDMITERMRIRCLAYDFLDAGDMEQEFLLYLAVRPEQAVSIAWIKAALDKFVSRTANDKRITDARETSYEAMFEEKEEVA